MSSQTIFASHDTLSGFDEGRLLRLVHDAIILTDLDGVVRVWNPGAERIYGFSESEMLGRKISDVYFPKDLAEIPSSIRNPVQAAAQGENLMEVILRRRHKDGHALTISLRIAVVCDAAGAVVGFVTCSNDVTKRIVAEALRAGGSGKVAGTESEPSDASGAKTLRWLTPRQREVLRLAAEGRTLKEIAETLQVTVKTVEHHKAQLMQRLGVRRSAELTAIAIRHGLVGQ